MLDNAPRTFCRMALVAQAVLAAPESYPPTSVEMALRFFEVCKGDCHPHGCMEAMIHAGILVR